MPSAAVVRHCRASPPTLLLRIDRWYLLDAFAWHLERDDWREVAQVAAELRELDAR